MTTGTRTTLWSETVVFASRHFLQWRRNPVIPLQSLLFPAILLVVYYLLVSKSMARLTGGDSLEVVVPMCALAGGFSAAVAGALTIPRERDSGLLSRFWVQPVHRASAVTGMLLAEAARTLLATLIITGLGVAFGLRFHGGIGAAVGFVVIPVIWVTVYSAVTMTVGLRFKSRTVLTWFSMFTLGSVFGSSAVVPMDVMPTWMHPLIRFQPMSPTIEAMRALANGDPAARALAYTAAWLVVVGTCAAFAAQRSYRLAAQSAGA